MSYHNNYPRPRSRLGAAVHGFFHPNEAYRLGTRTFSAEREADYYSRSARNSEERAFSAERERNDAEYDAEYNARLYERERQRRTQMQRGTVEYGRQHLQRGYRNGYRDGTGDTYQAASGQRRVAYAYGVRDGYDTRVAQEQASLGYGTLLHALIRCCSPNITIHLLAGHGPRGRPSQPRPQQQAPTSHPRQWGPATQQPRNEGTRGRHRQIEDTPNRIAPLPDGMHHSQWHGRAETVASNTSNSGAGSRTGGNRPRHRR